MSSRRATLFYGQNGRCFYCRQPMRLQTSAKRPNDLDCSLDHLIPRARGGLHLLKNKVAAHRSCNVAKADRMPTDDEIKRAGDLYAFIEGRSISELKQTFREHNPPGPVAYIVTDSKAGGCPAL